MRTFLAIELPDIVLASIRSTVLPLQTRFPKDPVRWVPIENMHVTLKFLGKTNSSDLADIKEQIKSCCRQSPAFDLELAGLGGFPAMQRPRVLWIGTKGSEQQVTELHGCIEARLQRLGFERENRKLHLHVTWGRVRRGTPASEQRVVGEALSDAEVGSLGQMRVEHLTLFESHLRPAGAEYEMLERFPLGPI